METGISILGLCRENGKEHGNYYIIGGYISSPHDPPSSAVTGFDRSSNMLVALDQQQSWLGTWHCLASQASNMI